MYNAPWVQFFYSVGICLKVMNETYFSLTIFIDTLLDRMEHEQLFYCSNLDVNSCFLISNPHQYHQGFFHVQANCLNFSDTMNLHIRM